MGYYIKKIKKGFVPIEGINYTTSQTYEEAILEWESVKLQWLNNGMYSGQPIFENEWLVKNGFAKQDLETFLSFYEEDHPKHYDYLPQIIYEYDFAVFSSMTDSIISPVFENTLQLTDWLCDYSGDTRDDTINYINSVLS